MLEALLGAPQGDEPRAKIAVRLRQLTGEGVEGFVQNEDQFSFLLMYFAAYFFLSFLCSSNLHHHHARHISVMLSFGFLECNGKLCVSMSRSGSQRLSLNAALHYFLPSNMFGTDSCMRSP